MNTNVFHSLTYGLYIVSTKVDDKMNGQIVNTVFQVTSSPSMIAVCIAKANFTHDLLIKAKKFSISILEQDAPMPFIGTFGFKSGRDIDKFKDIKYRIGVLDEPIVEDYSLGYLEVRIVNSVDTPTHTLFIGEVVDGDVLKQGVPMTYAYYHTVKNGKTPKTAPSFIDDKKEKQGGTTMDKYVCSVCGYVYDPAENDNVGFENLPEDWTCPVCGVGKDQFEKQ